jgi:hypothetical protein
VHRCMGSHRPVKGRIARARGRTWALATGPLPLPDQMGTKKIHEKKGGVPPPPDADASPKARASSKSPARSTDCALLSSCW